MSESIKMSHLDNMLILLDAAKKIGCKVNLGKSGIIVLVDGINALNKRIAELEVENERLQDAWFRDETICPDGSLRPKVSDLLKRVTELEAENAMLKQPLQPVELWSDEKKQTYKDNECRSEKSGKEVQE